MFSHSTIAKKRFLVFVQKIHNKNYGSIYNHQENKKKLRYGLIKTLANSQESNIK